VSSVVRFARDVPPPGVGRFSLSAARRAPAVVVAREAAGPGAGAGAGAGVRADAGVDAGADAPANVNAPASAMPSYAVVRLDLHTAAHLTPPQQPGDGTAAARGTDGAVRPGDNDNQRQPRQQPALLPALHDRPPFLPMGHVGGLRLFNSLWTICEQLGWSVEDEINPGQIMVDRRMMTSVQWLSNSLMIGPLLWTLFARWDLLISPFPLEYNYSGLPIAPTKQMRYLRSDECGIAAIFFVIMWLALGRYAERHICRTYDRSMIDFFGVNHSLEDEPSPSTTPSSSTSTTANTTNKNDNNNKNKNNTVATKEKRSLSTVLTYLQRQWDYLCPLSLQRLLFAAPHWNRRNAISIKGRVIGARSNDRRESQRACFSAREGRYKGDRILEGRRQLPGFVSRVVVCLLVGGGSFSASSPHYVLNLCTIFSCSISMGLSMSLNYMEISRTPRSISVLSKFRHMRFEVFVTMFFLVGQLVGSSGGILFLAEFVVTTIGLVLGGAATISTNAFESWVCFFCLSSTAFWGYLLARVSLANGVRQQSQRQQGVAVRGVGAAASMASSSCPSLLLIVSFFVFLVLWITSTLLCEWELPTTIMIVHPSWRMFFSMQYHNTTVMDGVDGGEQSDYYRNLLP